MKDHLDVLSTVPSRHGHFLLESGYHTDLWLTLDRLFVDPHKVAPLIDSLAQRLRPYNLSGVCGPLLGGAFLAQSLAGMLGLRFYCTEPVSSSGQGLFKAVYHLPPGQRELVRGENIAVVDEVIGAGSSVRATIEALLVAEAKVPVVAALLTLGGVAREYFSSRGVPLVALEHREFTLWKPADCPLCLSQVPLETVL